MSSKYALKSMLKSLLIAAALAAVTMPALAQGAWNLAQGVDRTTNRPTASATLPARNAPLSLVVNCGSAHALRAVFISPKPSKAQTVTIRFDKQPAAAWFALQRTASGKTLFYITNPEGLVSSLMHASSMAVRVPEEAAFDIPSNTRDALGPVLKACDVKLPPEAAKQRKS